ncbi:MAG: TolC family protein [Bacteroidales bacterium]|jgi:outer membrane protein TolC|nr:TolC family protein [Bacteroidales bacterium]OQC04027.1 MAG: Outer membrane efflux protein [Bacteroidetes bacterium ADurb.Bin090]MBP8981588.1 TolC family protein [Bacteroidales bacterium]HOD26204.1 TolC family protein [Bacteroidales bacterium]HOH24876.1 TolC family protein [Bacteroidales bacterium]
MRVFYISFLMLLSTVSIGAQTLDECRRLAREHYPEIRQYNLVTRTEQFNVSNAAKAWIPQVVLSGQATYQSAVPAYPEALKNMMQANGVDMSGTGMNKDQYRIAVDVTQNIWDGGQSKASRAMAEAEAAEQRSRADVSLYDLQSRVDGLYFGILLLDERMEQTKAMIEVLGSNLSRMRTYHENGVALQSDVDVMEAELLTAQQQLGQVESSLTSYRRMLEIFIGQSLISDKLERPAMPIIQGYTSTRPEFALLDAQENRLTAQRRAINSSVMPRFGAFAQGYYGYPGLDIFKDMTSTEWTLNGIVGVRMLWNISAFYTKNNNLEKINIAQQQLAVQREILQFNTRMLTTQDDGEIARLRKAVENDARIVELRRSVRMAAESQLKNGVIDATDLLRKITDETTAALNRNVHEIELLQAIYKLKHTLNE